MKTSVSTYVNTVHNNLELLIHTDMASFKELLGELKEIIDWWSFGKAVGIPKAQLMIVHKDGRTTEVCRRLLIEAWCKLEKPTWSAVVSSLFKCGMATLGWKIANKHGRDSYISYILS